MLFRSDLIIDQDQLLNLPIEFTPIIKISTQTKSGIEKLEIEIQNKIDLILSQDTAPFLLNQRQFKVLTSVSQMSEDIIKMLSNPEFELISLHLNEALQLLSNLSGKTITESSMDMIFREFCVGK